MEIQIFRSSITPDTVVTFSPGNQTKSSTALHHGITYNIELEMAASTAPVPDALPLLSYLLMQAKPSTPGQHAEDFTVPSTLQKKMHGGLNMKGFSHEMVKKGTQAVFYICV